MSKNAEVSAEVQGGAESINTTDNGATLALHAECWPGGPVVSDPKDCLDIDRNRMESSSSLLPQIELSDSGSLTDFNAKPLDGNPPLNPTDDWTDPTNDSQHKPGNESKLAAAAKPIDGDPPLNPTDDWTDPTKDSQHRPESDIKLAGRTRRNNGSGISTNERDATLDRRA